MFDHVVLARHAPSKAIADEWCRWLWASQVPATTGEEVPRVGVQVLVRNKDRFRADNVILSQYMTP